MDFTTHDPWFAFEALNAKLLQLDSSDPLDLEEKLPSVGVPLPFDARLVAMSMGLEDGNEAKNLCEDRQHRVLAAAVLMQIGLVERGL